MRTFLQERKVIGNRRAAVSFWHRRKDAIAYLLLALATALAIFLSVSAVSSESQSACAAVNRVRFSLSEVLHRQQAGLPTVTYYKQHPAELKQAEADIKFDLDKLGPIACSNH